MRGYEQDEYEGYDDYEDEEQEEGYEEVEEYEEEEQRKPTVEEIKYLELRERPKDRIRKEMNSENTSANSKSLEKKMKHPSDNYGSFFGHSKPVIAERVIQESKSFLENQHLAEKVLSSHQNNKKSSSAGAVSKNGVCQQPPKAASASHKKIQNLKATRDYSFLLSDDAEIPSPPKEPASRNVSARKSGFLLMFKRRDPHQFYRTANNFRAINIFMVVMKKGRRLFVMALCFLKKGLVMA